MLTPGPTLLPEEVKLSLAQELIHHRKDEFKKIFNRIRAGLKYLFGTKQEVLVLTSSGTGAMVAGVQNIFTPGEKVLVVEGGKFGQRFKEIALNWQLQVVSVEVEWGRAVSIEEIEAEYKKHPDIKGILVQASETSTGVLHPIEKIAAFCKDKNILSLVDGISAVGISPCPMDEWGIDCLLTGSQKGLMLPPGLAFIALSSKAWEKVEKNPKRPFYFDLIKEKNKVLYNQTAYTPSISLLVALEKSLQYFIEKGLHNIYLKQKALTEMVRWGVSLIGLEPLVKENYTWGLTSVILPKAIKASNLLEYMQKDFGYTLAGGQDRLKNRIIRIGHMGYVDYVDMMGVLFALKESYVKCGGFSGARNFLEESCQVYWKTLRQGGK